MQYNIIEGKTRTPGKGKGVIMKTIETIVMKNNHTADVRKLAKLLGIEFISFTASYNEETNCTSIYFVCKA